MRNLRLLLLLGVAAMLVAVVLDYVDSRRVDAEVRVGDLKAIPSELNSQASRWHWAQSSGDWRKVEIFADSFRQSKKTHLFDLEGVELRIFDENGKTYDEVISSAAEFDSRTETLYSEGEVTLLLGLPVNEVKEDKDRPTRIRSSGVTFETKTGVCQTDRYTEYEFEGGSGHSQGAFYDSANRYFRMNAEAYLQRNAATGRPAVAVRSAELQYHENDQRIDLKGGVTMDRGSQSVRAAEANVYLEGGAIRRIEAREAEGSESQPQRTVAFRGAVMTLWYNDGELLERVNGSGAAELRSTAAASETRAWGERIELIYAAAPGGDDSELREADVRERAGIEVRPARPRQGAGGDLRRVKSEWIHLTMRPGGQEIDVLETVAPGTLELIPGDPQDWTRRLAAKVIRAAYGPGNRMEKLRALGNVEVVSSRAAPGEPGSADPLLTWSSNLEADFDSSGEAKRIKQWEDFRFEQGGRQGSSGEAEFDPANNLVALQGKARVSDTNGNVTAHKIMLDDRAGTFEAEGDVSATHREGTAETNGGESPAGVFSAAEPVFATARRMFSNQESGVLRYEGQARLWQGANRIEAERVEIHRPEKTLLAQGSVVSIFRAEEGKQAEPGPPDGEFVTVSADSMEYDEQKQRALYSGTAQLLRDNLTVRSEEIEAFLEPDGDEGQTQLRVAYARGRVSIVKGAASAPERRQGFGEEAEYHPAKATVILSGEPARLRSASGNETRGAKLTYHIDDDRLLVVGSGRNRAYTYRAEKGQKP